MYIKTYMIKPVEFLGDSLDVLRAFPAQPRREAGYQIDRVQRGLDPNDWKPMGTVGSGVREIRIRHHSGAYRVILMARFRNAVYVLHCFRKTSEQTSGPDLDVARKRYRELKGPQ
jgi:phage-related protein